MAISQVSLSASARSNLLALKNTAKLLQTTQSHLSSGKKVNSALDNASSYFASKGFINSANDLDGLKDSMSTALQTIKAATDAIDSITAVVNQMQGIVNSALQTTNDASRATYSQQYNDLKDQLDSLANDASFNGTNLVNSLSAKLKVIFNADNTTSLTVTGKNLKSDGMGVNDAVGSWAQTALASEKDYTLTIQAAQMSNTSATLVSTALASNLSVTGADSTSGNTAVMSSTASVALDGTDTTTTGAIATGAGTAKALGTAALTALAAAGLTAVYDSNLSGNSTAQASIIEGQFTVTGGSAATLVDGANATLTAAATNATGLTFSLGVNQTIRIVHDDGTDRNTYVYTNNTSSAITWNAGNAADTVALQGSADSSLSYNLTTGTVSTSQFADGSAFTLPTTGTLDGHDIVESGLAAAGTEVTYSKTTQAAQGTLKGTTTSTGEIAYDLASATLNSISVTSVRATMTNNTVANTTYGAGASGLTVDIEAVTELHGSAVTTVDDALTTSQNQLKDALTALRAAASEFGNNNTLVQTRLDFTTNLISTLSTASDNLVLADTNEEGANMQALQAQSQLGIVALSISGQQAQAILRLF